MPIQSEAIQYGPWTQGVRYDRPAEVLPPDALYAMQNCRLGLPGNITTRNGQANYIETAIAGTPTITGCGQHSFSAASSSVFAVAGTAWYEDVAGTWTARTGAATITAGNDNTWTFADANGTLLATNGVSGDTIVKWAAAGGNIAALGVSSRFTWCKTIAYWDNRAWAGNLSSGTDQVWRSDTGNIESWSATAYYYVDQPVTALVSFRSALTIHTQNGIWALFPTGDAGIPYSLSKRADLGALSARGALVNAHGQMLFIRREGIYEWTTESMTSEQTSSTPTRISQALDGARFWDNVNKNRLAYAFALDYPDQSVVGFYLPYGASQQTMNRVVWWDYLNRRWYGPDVLSLPAACAGLISRKPHTGGISSGILTTHDTGTDDDGVAIDAWFETAAPPMAEGSFRVRWLYARHYYSTTGEYALTVSQIAPEIGSNVQTIDLGAADAAIETAFTVGVSPIASEDALYSEDTDLLGYAPSTRLRYRNANLGEYFNMRYVLLNGKPLYHHRKPKAQV